MKPLLSSPASLFFVPSKRTLLFILMFLSLGPVFAQSPGRFVVRLSDGTTHDLDRTAAFIDPDRSLSINAKTKGGLEHNFMIKIKPTSDDMKSVIKGKYQFNQQERLLDYVPGGPSSNYDLTAYYSQKNNQSISQEWMSAQNPAFGFIEIESITADRVKGKFKCEIVQGLPVKGAKKTMEGNFDVPIIKASASSQTTAPASNSGTSSAVSQPASSPAKSIERQPVLGLYDLQFAVSAITSGDMGIDLDLGTTLVNLSYGKTNDASATIELHYDHSRNKYGETLNDMNFRRNHVYARLRPFTSRPNGEIDAENFVALFIAGIYADLGYTKGYYYYTDVNGDRKGPDYNADGLFWGMGWNLIWRKESRWGANVGFGSKRYTITLPNGSENKYKTRLITLGVVYNLLWKD